MVHFCLRARTGFRATAWTLGYTIMVGVVSCWCTSAFRSYRDNVLNGQNHVLAVRLRVGLLITAIACACYVVTWGDCLLQLYAATLWTVYFCRAGAGAPRVSGCGTPGHDGDTDCRDFATPSSFYQTPLVNMGLYPDGALAGGSGG